MRINLPILISSNPFRNMVMIPHNAPFSSTHTPGLACTIIATPDKSMRGKFLQYWKTSLEVRESVTPSSQSFPPPRGTARLSSAP